nr:nucleotidyltransferase family protein [Lachnospiraceae bacterium]
ITEDDFSSVLYMRLNTMSDEELFSIPDINPDVIHKLTNFRGKKILISDLIMNLKSKCFTYTGISRALFRILLSPFYTAAAQTHFYDIRPYRSVTENDTDNTISYKPYLRVLGFKKSCSEFLRDLRYSDDINIITKPSAGPLDNPAYKLDIYAAGLYEQICSNKFKTGFTEELKTGPVIFD